MSRKQTPRKSGKPKSLEETKKRKKEKRRKKKRLGTLN